MQAGMEGNGGGGWPGAGERDEGREPTSINQDGRGRGV